MAAPNLSLGQPCINHVCFRAKADVEGQGGFRRMTENDPQETCPRAARNGSCAAF
jgi:hypothetical protein